MVDVIIIGGGASGMMAALTAAQNTENRVTLLERQARVGRKLLSTGNGRCNLTNTQAGPEHYHGGTDFAGYALRAFTPEDTLGFFERLGLLTSREHGGRVYPLSNQANSVVDVLRFALEQAGVRVMTSCPAESVGRCPGGFAVKSALDTLYADKLIVACGGCAGSKLGGVTDGYKLLASLGHSRTALYPALTQLRTDTAYPRALKGVRAHCRVTLRRGKEVLAGKSGELLFTDTGVSGTVIFELSRAVSSGGEGLELSLDFLPGMDEGAVVEYLRARRENAPSLPANRILTGTVHNRLGQMLCRYAGVSGELTAPQLADDQLRALAAACGDFRLRVTGVSGFESAQVTAGGVRTEEFVPYTLESRLVPGLFACGEVLDVDGDCGGYNLQWAWSSGRLAGRLGK